MNSIWFFSFALVISANWCELQALNMGSGKGLPPGRGTLCSIIHRRHMFWASTQSP